MALNLDCMDCQAGLSQVGQMAIGFNCAEHGSIGLEISELMKIARMKERKRCLAILEQLKEETSAVLGVQLVVQEAYNRVMKGD